MFKPRDTSDPIKWPVKVSVPKDGGVIDDRHGFTAHFKVLDAPSLQKFDRRPPDALLKEVVVGWEEDLRDEQEDPLPYAAELRDALIDNLHIRNALHSAYWDMMAGREAKN